MVCVFDQNLLMVVNISRFRSKTHATEQNSTHIPCIVSPSKLLLSCIRISTVDARRTSVTLSCLLWPTSMYANFAPPLLGPLPLNEAGRSSEGMPSQWPAPTYGTVFPPPSEPSTPTQSSVVRSRHICSAQHLTISFYIYIDIVMHNRSIFNLYDWAL